MFIAERLGKFEHEVVGLPPREFARWVAYFRIKEDGEKTARSNSKLKPLPGRRLSKIPR